VSRIRQIRVTPWCLFKNLPNFTFSIHVAQSVVIAQKSSSFLVLEPFILLEISYRKANWIGHILHSNCHLGQSTEGKIKGGIEVTGRRGTTRREIRMTLRKGKDTHI
jgi:hypothetical protein